MAIYTDGHLQGPNGINGKFASIGYTHLLRDTKDRKVFYEKKRLTSNEAELLAIAHACMYARQGETIYSDSTIAVNAGKRGRAIEKRFELIAVLIKTMIEIKKLNIKWIPREQNPIT